MDLEEKITQALDRANQRLRAGNTGLIIFRRGKKLSLRGTLPPKPGKTIASQQTIAMDIYANFAGITRIEKEALKISGQIATREFDWKDYLKTSSGNVSTTLKVGHLIRDFEVDYFSKRARTPETETTWESDYLSVLKKLPVDKPFTDTLMLDLILSTQPDSRTRLRTCKTLKIIAAFAGIDDFDPMPYKGSYSAKKVQPRDIPSDAVIAEFYDRIPDSHGWKYAYGLMASYGLRNYEVFYLDLGSLVNYPGHAYITDGCNGGRSVWCLYPEWWEKWKLYEITRPLPQVTGRNNSKLGSRTVQALARYGWKKPYNLRHAWAIRALTFGLPVEMAAKMMDHSVKVHVDTYQHWITQDHERRIYDLLMKDSPKPP